MGSRGESIVQDDSKTFDTVDLASIYRDNKRASFCKNLHFIVTEFGLIEVMEIRKGGGKRGSWFCRKRVIDIKMKLYTKMMKVCLWTEEINRKWSQH